MTSNDTLTVMIKLDGQDVMVNLENGKVIGGSILKGDNEVPLKITNRYKLCDYPYIQMAVV